MLVHANQNKLQQLKDGMIWNRMLLPNVYVYVVFFNDIKIKMCLIKTHVLVLSGGLFCCKNIPFWLAKTNFQLAFTDSRQLL